MRKLFVALLAVPLSLLGGTISGTVKDSSGALVSHARLEINGGALTHALVFACDDQGRFQSPELAPGSYLLLVTSEGFEPAKRPIEIGSLSITTDVQLSIAKTKQEITVHGKPSAFANTDPVYVRLRNLGLGTAFAVQGFTLKYDVATFQFKQGTLSFLAPVNGMVTGAVFVGQGHFGLTPTTAIDRKELRRRVDADQFEEDFKTIVFRFTNGANRDLLRGTAGEAVAPPEAAAALEHCEDKLRHRREVPLGFSEHLLDGDTMDNVEADILASLYNKDRLGFFSAYIHGVKHDDLRFIVRQRGGAIPQLDSPEEVALINYDPEGMQDGIWYLAHLQDEYQKGTASSHEETRYVAARKFKVDTVIARNDHLTSVARVTFEPLMTGERVIKFRLLPNLRVTRVSDAEGKELYFIQESRKADGSFYVILTEPTKAAVQSTVTVEYSGDKVVRSAGDGSFYVGAREAWYPNLNGFTERALYDLTFRVPKRYKVISVGSLDREWIDDNFAVSHWTTPKPIAVAGFNYGDYRKTEMEDPKTGYHLEGYFLSELPDSLRPYQNGALAAMSPAGMTKYALEQARAQIQVCTYYFGKSPFDRIYITEQPNFSYGQSWPNLVYLPISAYIDSTQRWMLFGNINNRFTAFVQEVTPHEVAHQWWGHAVGWASYHDQWLSEGFAEFSAALFIEDAEGKGWQKDYIEFWERLRRRVLEKNEWGISPNDAGPIWLGLRLTSPRTMNAYVNVTYPKGAFILAMLRSMMYNNKDGDKLFIDMMHDFVDSHRDTPASTESFKAIAEKHITRVMDLRANGRLDWFFDEWVYGTDVPRYKFDYSIEPGKNGKPKLHMTLSQSEVGKDFAMLVPVYGDFGKGLVRIGQLRILGENTRTFDFDLPEQPKKVVLNAFKEILER